MTNVITNGLELQYSRLHWSNDLHSERHAARLAFFPKLDIPDILLTLVVVLWEKVLISTFAKSFA